MGDISGEEVKEQLSLQDEIQNINEAMRNLDSQTEISLKATQGDLGQVSFDSGAPVLASNQSSIPSYHPSPVQGPNVEPPSGIIGSADKFLSTAEGLTPHGAATANNDESCSAPYNGADNSFLFRSAATAASLSGVADHRMHTTQALQTNYQSPNYSNTGGRQFRERNGTLLGDTHSPATGVSAMPFGSTLTHTRAANEDMCRSAAGSGTSAKAGEGASTKAVLSALQALQDKIRRLEGERDGCTQLCERLRAKTKATEHESSRRIEAELGGARERAQRQVEALEKLSGDKGGLETRLVRMREEKLQLASECSAARIQAEGLEQQRRTAEARWASHQDRALRLEEQLKASQVREAAVASRVSTDIAATEVKVADLRGRLGEAEEQWTAERSACSAIAQKQASAEDMLSNLVGIVDHLIRTDSTGAPQDDSKSKGGKIGRGRDGAKVKKTSGWTDGSRALRGRAESTAYSEKDDDDDDAAGDPHYSIATKAHLRQKASAASSGPAKLARAKSQAAKATVGDVLTTKRAAKIAHMKKWVNENQEPPWAELLPTRSQNF